jgi:hypothetical protein
MPLGINLIFSNYSFVKIVTFLILNLILLYYSDN